MSKFEIVQKNEDPFFYLKKKKRKELWWFGVNSLNPPYTDPRNYIFIINLDARRGDFVRRAGFYQFF